MYVERKLNKNPYGGFHNKGSDVNLKMLTDIKWMGRATDTKILRKYLNFEDVLKSYKTNGDLQ